ncbi:DUF3795 domain-containing protein [Candidatus Dojkabacteria bacterium]|nr:DUF3795 domain-containing protein [Candidatus Dojkabacteria bacterium]
MIKSNLIAPCGMNCALCLGYIREKNRCAGCRGDEKGMPTYCGTCKMKECAKAKGFKYCFECDKYPCMLVKHVDKRYRTRYGMSMIENLDFIKAHGIRAFVKKEKARWTCKSCGAMLCVHRPVCLNCGAQRNPPMPVPTKTRSK